MALDVDELLERAKQACGLSDWGADQAFRVGLQQLTEAGKTAGIPPAAIAALEDQIVSLLVTRLHFVEDENQHPEITSLPIERPLILTGLARTGTTILHSLCALDPAGRPPQTWEAESPWPAPEIATYATDPRIALAQKSIDARLAAMPILRTMHPWGATLPADCLPFLALSFVTTRFMASFYVPDYTHWLSTTHPEGIYRTHKRALQQLQWRGPRGRWILKEPQHLLHLPDLMDAYPDACIVQTHRDPVRTIPSVASLIGTIQAINKPDIDKQATGRQVLQVFGAHLERSTIARQDPNRDGRILDIAYRDTVQDPVGTVRRIYDHFALPFTEEHALRIAQHMKDQPKDKHGVHTYSAEEFGLDPEALKALAPAYRQRFELLLGEPQGQGRF